MSLPIIIQGGMGVGVSNWTLAKSVSQQGQLGVVSGTLLAIVLARRLQLGDTHGHIRRALATFPLPDVTDWILKTYYVPGGIPETMGFKPVPMPTLPAGRALTELTVAANYTEVFLAKEGHTGVVGINLLEKIQIPTLPSLYGAMLAGVDYVLMGAGIPRTIPGVLDRLAAGQAAELKIDTTPHPSVPAEEQLAHFDPANFLGRPAPILKRPRFLAIVSSATLATTLARKSNGQVDGFIVETAAAGGHNAPPRGPLQLNPAGEPIYGIRDQPDVEKIRALGLPFWLAGDHATPEKVAAARALGATGVQIGTAFAFSQESGITPSLKQQICTLSREGRARTHTDPAASPTGMPFKVVQLDTTLSDQTVYQARPRICDLGYLRECYTKPDGNLGYRCPGEPSADYQRKGGCYEDTLDRKCLCNGLLATVGLSQKSGDQIEPALLTAGQDIAAIARYLAADQLTYTAEDVIAYALSGQPQPTAPLC